MLSLDLGRELCAYEVEYQLIQEQAICRAPGEDQRNMHLLEQLQVGALCLGLVRCRTGRGSSVRRRESTFAPLRTYVKGRWWHLKLEQTYYTPFTLRLRPQPKLQARVLVLRKERFKAATLTSHACGICCSGPSTKRRPPTLVASVDLFRLGGVTFSGKAS